MAWLQTTIHLCQRVITAVLLLAHLLAAFSLVAFGWRTGGYALNGLASYSYLVLAALAAVLFVATSRRTDEWAVAGRVVMAPWLALLVVGAWTATSAYGATYATWGALTGDDLPYYALLHLAYAVLGCGLALGLRWPKLLLAWAFAHAIAFALGLVVFASWQLLLLSANPTEFIPILLTLAVYPLAALALGWQPPRAWDRSALSQQPVGPQWLAFGLASLVGLLVAAQLLSPDQLPRAGEVQRWISDLHIVPANAWLPTLAWSAGLFVVSRWLLIPLVAFGFLAGWLHRRSLTVTPATWLVWAGLAPLLAVGLGGMTPVGLIANVVVSGFSPAWYLWQPYSLLPVSLAFGLFLSARIWERPLNAGARAGLALGVLAMLGLLVLAQIANAWLFARFLLAPLPAWATVAEYAPASPQLLAALGLAIHGGLAVFGFLALGRTVGIIRQQWRDLPSAGLAARRLTVIGTAGVIIIGSGWYAVTDPRTVQVVPKPDAANVPRDTLVMIQFAAPNSFDTFLAAGFGGGLQARYADSGEYISGTTGLGPGGLYFDADGLLRPNAPVEIVARWANKRPYVLRFTTAGPAEPSATPLPYPTDWPAPVPTAQVTLASGGE
jgi:hypothetical protein